MKNRDILLGLTGLFSSGKDTVAAHLVKKYGFASVTLSDIIRFHVAEHGAGEPTRDLLRDTGNLLREEHGADYLMRKALENPAQRLIVSGIRTVGEAETLKTDGGKIIFCTAPLETRFNWAQGRGTSKDGITFEEFKAQEEKERTSENPEAQNINKVISMADFTINNDGSKEDLEEKIDRLMSSLVDS